MNIAVMQPYLFPHLPYFQLVHAVDRFVVLDDVRFIARGWINRNRILSRQGPLRFTLPLRKASQNREIRELERADDERWRRRFLSTLHHSYRRAPHFEATMDLVARVFQHDERRLAPWLLNGLRLIGRQLGMPDRFVPSAAIYANGHLKGVQRIVDICAQEHATCYVNGAGGRGLYEPSTFEDHALQLRFVDSRLRPYRQLDLPFVSGLSILDVLMFNGREEIEEHLTSYSLN
jgi:hypothetical protein